jgi:ribosomal protein S7
MKRNIKIKNKFINHLLKHGKKKTYESIVLKSFKNIQKSSDKPLKKIIRLAIINSTPIFRIKTLRKKRRKKIEKEVPAFVYTDFERISWGLKYCLYFTKNFFSLKLYKKLEQEILLNAQQNKGDAEKKKIEYHKQAVLNHRFLINYRW